MDEVSKCSNNDSREDIRSILKPKGHEIVIKRGPFSSKSGLLLIFLCNAYLEIT
jgi:hypothetical protein